WKSARGGISGVQCGADSRSFSPIQLPGTFDQAHGFRSVALLRSRMCRQDPGEAVKRIRRVWFGLEHFPEMGCRFIKLTLLGQKRSQVSVCLGLIWLKSECGDQPGRCGFRLALRSQRQRRLDELLWKIRPQA